MAERLQVWVKAKGNSELPIFVLFKELATASPLGASRYWHNCCSESIAKTFIVAHDGKIALDSAVEFIIKFPVWEHCSHVGNLISPMSFQ